MPLVEQWMNCWFEKRLFVNSTRIFCTIKIQSHPRKYQGSNDHYSKTNGQVDPQVAHVFIGCLNACHVLQSHDVERQDVNFLPPLGRGGTSDANPLTPRSLKDVYLLGGY